MGAWSKVDKGQKLARQGRFDEAESLIKAGVEALGDQPRPLIQLGLCRLDAGDADGAVESFTRAGELDPHNPAVPLFLALALADLGRLEEARRAAGRVQELEPHSQTLPTLLMILDFRQGAPGDALGREGEVAASPPLLGRLVVEVERRLLPTEIEHLYRTKALDPDAIDTEPEPDRPGFIDSLRHLPTSSRAMRLQKRGLKIMDRAMHERQLRHRHTLVNEALSLLRESRELDSNLFRSAFYLGEALLFASRPDPTAPHDRAILSEARDCFVGSWRYDGGNPYVFYYLGRVSTLLGEIEAGAEYFRRALERFEKLPEAHYGLGQCELLQGNETSARHYFLKAVNSDLQLARERLRELEGIFQEDKSLLDGALPKFVPEEPPAAAEQAEPEAPS